MSISYGKDEVRQLITGFKITKVHPIEGVTTEVSFTSEIRGEGRYPSEQGSQEYNLEKRKNKNILWCYTFSY
jgi:hypothetical protein